MKDKIFALDASYAEIGGALKDVFAFVNEKQLMDPALWTKFVAQFQPGVDDADRGWRCEYWGKMMRGAAWVYRCTKDQALYDILETTVRELLTRQDELGRISSYSVENELDGWDIWGRKYVMLGMQYFSEICPDEELKATLLDSMKRQADALIAKIGDGEGQKCISDASRHWKGINSCSVLEPIVRLYNLTGEQRYFDFATYVVGICENGIAPIFTEAYENKLDPYEFTVVKAYETTSCFEGLIEYYRVTKDERYRTMALNYAYRLLKSDVSIIGCCGCTHELFDHSAIRQTDRSLKGIMQETCVTVTIMKFMQQVLRLSADPVFADCIETAFYNAYMGTMNTKDCETSYNKDTVSCVLPFDSYSPLAAGARGKRVGGFKVMADGSAYGCCACIASAGVGMMPGFALMQTEEGIVLNTYYEGVTAFKTLGGQTATLTTQTAYPFGSHVEIKIALEHDEAFAVQFRVPAWSRKTSATVNGDTVAAENGYNVINRTWKNGDVIAIDFDNAVYLVNPPAGAVDEDKMRAIQRGGIVYAVSAELGEDPLGVHAPLVDEEGRLTDVEEIKLDEIPEAYAALSIGCADGKRMRVVDYASAGRDYASKLEFCAWFAIKE